MNFGHLFWTYGVFLKNILARKLTFGVSKWSLEVPNKCTPLSGGPGAFQGLMGPILGDRKERAETDAEDADCWVNSSDM